ncbi:hypothetical protein [Ferruginibacter albus]|nr:hypothetical protein [Ferruginibacter albus]
MRKVILFAIVAGLALAIASCSRGITPYEAANGKAKCGRYIR